MENLDPVRTIKAQSVAVIAYLGFAMNGLMMAIARLGNRGEVGGAGGAAGGSGGTGGAGGGTGTVDWKATLPAEMQSLPALQKFNTPADLLKSYTELEKQFGYEKIALPRKDKDGNYDQADKNRFYEALGRPKDPTGYETPKDFKLPPGVDPKTPDMLKGIFHKYDLLPGQAQGLMQEIGGLLAKGEQLKSENDKKAFEDGIATLRQDWGHAYEQKMKVVQAMLKQFAPQETADAIVKKFGNDPDLARLFDSIGSKLSEDAIDMNGMKGTLMTPQEAEVEIKKIYSDAKHPYFVAGHPDHKFWVDKVQELHEMALKK